MLGSRCSSDEFTVGKPEGRRWSRPTRYGPVAMTARALPTTSAAEDTAPRRPGRPRDKHADEAILEAVIDLLVEEGFGGLTIDAVAQRAGVGKATIYRRWAGKESLVLDALATTKEVMATPDTGALRTDLLEIYAHMSLPVTQQTVTRLMPALAAEAAVNPELAERLRVFVSERRLPSRTVLERGRERGEVRADVDIDLCIDVLTGPFLYRLLFTGSQVDDDLIAATIDLVLRAVAP